MPRKFASVPIWILVWSSGVVVIIRESLNTQRYPYYDLTTNIYPRMFGIEPINSITFVYLLLDWDIIDKTGW